MGYGVTVLVEHHLDGTGNSGGGETSKGLGGSSFQRLLTRTGTAGSSLTQHQRSSPVLRNVLPKPVLDI